MDDALRPDQPLRYASSGWESALGAHRAEIDLVNAETGGFLVLVRLPLGSV